jgi:hypothetical protein
MDLIDISIPRFFMVEVGWMLNADRCVEIHPESRGGYGQLIILEYDPSLMAGRPDES